MPCTLTVVERNFESVQLHRQGLNAVPAVLRLSRRYGPVGLEAACRIALHSHLRSQRYAHLRPLLHTETKRKMREMNATDMLHAIEAQDETLSMGLTFEGRVRLIVDVAHSAFSTSPVGGLLSVPSCATPTLICGKWT